MTAYTAFNLDVWQISHALTLEIYRFTKSFPKEELYGVVSQMRRSASSVPANITEGYRRFGPKDKAKFYNIAEASLAELQYFLILSRDLGYLEDYEMRTLEYECVRVGKMLSRLASRVKQG